MKTFIQAKKDYLDKLEEGAIYELVAIIETDKSASGKVVVIEVGNFLEIYDSETFFK